MFAFFLCKELEKSASRKLKINAKETMKIAEKLYTAGYISYPRTETNIFPKDFDLNALIEKQTSDNNWGGVYKCFKKSNLLFRRCDFILFSIKLLEFATELLQAGATPRNGTKSDQGWFLK